MLDVPALFLAQRTLEQGVAFAPFFLHRICAFFFGGQSRYSRCAENGAAYPNSRCQNQKVIFVIVELPLRRLWSFNKRVPCRFPIFGKQVRPFWPVPDVRWWHPRHLQNPQPADRSGKNPQISDQSYQDRDDTALLEQTNAEISCRLQKH